MCKTFCFTKTNGTKFVVNYVFHAPAGAGGGAGCAAAGCVPHAAAGCGAGAGAGGAGGTGAGGIGCCKGAGGTTYCLIKHPGRGTHCKIRNCGDFTALACLVS